MADWKEYKLGEIANVTKLAGFEYTKHFEYIEDGEIISLRALNVRNGNLDLTNVKRISKSVSDSLVRSKLFKGDILLTYVGANIGQFALIDENDKYHLAPNICRIRAEKCLPYFLFSYFRTDLFQESLANFSVGSSQPTLPMGNIRQIEILLPPLPEQQSIAEVLSSLDDKIDLLHRQNTTLETIAETLFRQWFVEEAEENWERKSLGEIANYLNGLALQNYPINNGESLRVIKIRELNQGITESTDKCSREVPEPYIVHDGDILFSWSGSLQIVIWHDGEGALNQHLFKVTSETYPKWFYYLATKHHLDDFRAIAESKSTTMGHIQRHHLTEAFVSVPPKELFEKYDANLSPLIEKLIKNNAQIKILTKQRDALLPKLMSGEVRVGI
jgi:type I restriction enzyme, S subunit